MTAHNAHVPPTDFDDVLPWSTIDVGHGIQKRTDRGERGVGAAEPDAGP